MLALKKLSEDPGEFLPVPPEVRHRRTEVIFLVLDQAPEANQSEKQQQFAELAGSWEGELVREQPSDAEERLELS